MTQLSRCFERFIRCLFHLHMFTPLSRPISHVRPNFCSVEFDNSRGCGLCRSPARGVLHYCRSGVCDANLAFDAGSRSALLHFTGSDSVRTLQYPSTTLHQSHLRRCIRRRYVSGGIQASLLEIAALGFEISTSVVADTQNQ